MSPNASLSPVRTGCSARRRRSSGSSVSGPRWYRTIGSAPPVAASIARRTRLGILDRAGLGEQQGRRGARVEGLRGHRRRVARTQRRDDGAPAADDVHGPAHAGDPLGGGHPVALAECPGGADDVRAAPPPLPPTSRSTPAANAAASIPSRSKGVSAKPHSPASDAAMVSRPPRHPPARPVPPRPRRRHG